MHALHTPGVFADGRWWSARVIDQTARRLHWSAVHAIGSHAGLVAIIVPRSVQGIAVVIAASALDATVVFLPPDERAWQSDPAIPARTPIVLLPELSHLAPSVERLGCRACPINDDGSLDAPAITLMRATGMVWFTSGSTGLPRPVFRTCTTVMALVEQRFAALPLPEGGGIASADSLAHGQGLIEFLLSCRLGGTFAPLDPLNMRGAMAVLRMPEIAIWFTTPQIADVLSRVPLEGSPVVPPLCFVAGAVPQRTADSFDARFGRRLRQHYGTSEGGLVAIDAGDESAVREGRVGRVVGGVDVCIGDAPTSQVPRGTTGRIWIRSRGQMDGYGFPPITDRSAFVDGWFPTSDLGVLEDDGHLSLAGRIDDCIRGRDGRLVNLARVAACLREADGVGDAVAVPLETSSGLTFGAIVEGSPSLDRVREHVSAELPPWCWPRSLIAVTMLPRLSNGKVDRAACGELLERADRS